MLCNPSANSRIPEWNLFYDKVLSRLINFECNLSRNLKKLYQQAVVNSLRKYSILYLFLKQYFWEFSSECDDKWMFLLQFVTAARTNKSFLFSLQQCLNYFEPKLVKNLYTQNANLKFPSSQTLTLILKQVTIIHFHVF